MILAIVFSIWAVQSFLAWGLCWGNYNKQCYSYVKADSFDIWFPFFPLSFLIMSLGWPLSWAWGPLTQLQRYRIYCERFPNLSASYTYKTFDNGGY